MADSSSSGKQKTKQSKWPLFVSIGLLLSLVIGYLVIPSFKDFVNNGYDVLSSGDKTRISQWVNAFGFWGPVLIVIMMVLQMFLIVVPSPLLIVVSVLAYGPLWGSLLSILSIMAASSVGYFIGRFLGEVTVDRLIGHRKEQKLEFYMARYGIWAIVVTRLSPLFSNDAISFVGGILRMGYWKFIFATLGGITPLVLLIAYFGENNERLKTGLIWVSAISLVLLVVYVIYDKKKKPAKAA